ncbi:alpha/beta hydrolase [Nocardia barduliensis]|uniref:alpha/beta hydrolase n=1 Tax=Nocardia barduliensis TaxID=2736643 RepID=UPI00157393F6|nr:alpha/beta hydrolase [Nocardia barduliensis]
MTLHSLTFPSHDGECHAWHFPAASDRLATDAGRPAVVMAHGFAATKDCGLAGFAEHLVRAGLDVLAFDYRGFGDSTGQPRQVISLAGQIQDYRSALNYAARLPGIDARRLVLWGVSLSGGTVLEVAAGRTDIAAIVALTPLISGLPDRTRRSLPETSLMSRTCTAVATVRLLLRGIQDKRAAATGRTRLMAPAVGWPHHTAFLRVPGAFDDYASIAGPNWRNEVNASFALDALAHRPIRFAAKVRCPVLFQIADFDRSVSVDAAMRAATRARAQIRHYPCDHFDVYPGKPWHEQVREHQAQFLTRTLTKNAATATGILGTQ